MTQEQIIEIKKRIRESREKRGLSTKYVAEKLNVTIMAVYKWESTTTYLMSLPSLDNIVLYCELFNVSTDYILLGR